MLAHHRHHLADGIAQRGCAQGLDRFGEQEVAERHLAELHREKAELAHPLVIVEFREIARTRIGEDDHRQPIRLQFAAILDRARQRRAGRAARENPLLAHQLPRPQKRLAVARALDPVHHAQVGGGRQKVLADALHLVRFRICAFGDRPFVLPNFREDRTLDVHAHNFDVRILGLEISPDSADRPARAHADDDVGHATFGLLPDLGAGRHLVGFRVIGIVILVRQNRVGRLTHEALCHLVVRARVIGRDRGGCDDHLRSIGAQVQNLLVAHFVGHDEDGLVTFQGRGNGETYARVPRSRLDNRPAGDKFPALLGPLDNVRPDAVLDRAAGVHKFQFCI